MNGSSPKNCGVGSAQRTRVFGRHRGGWQLTAGD
jgi:hypothetical protein